MYGKALAIVVCKKIVGENPTTSTLREDNKSHHRLKGQDKSLSRIKCGFDSHWCDQMAR